MRPTSFISVICLLVLAPIVMAAQITTTTVFKTNEQGEYRIEFLPVGKYAVAVNAVGFKKFIQNGVTLEVGQTARIDASLDLGSTGEVVEVTAAAPIVNTSSPELGRTVENAEIIDLPIVNRNLYTLLDLTPGVQRNDNSIVLGYPEQRTLINGGVDGGAGSVNYFLDGGINITGLRNTGNILPNPDAIQEFRVQTNSYSAEYGRFASGVINTAISLGQRSAVPSSRTRPFSLPPIPACVRIPAHFLTARSCPRRLSAMEISRSQRSSRSIRLPTSPTPAM